MMAIKHPKFFLYSKLLLVLFALLFIFLFVPPAYSLGLSPPDGFMNFVPGTTVLLSYDVDDAPREIDVKVSGAFSEYATISKLNRKSDHWYFNVTVNLPEKTTLYGSPRMGIQVLERTGSAGTVGTRLGLNGWVQFEVPYPGLYAEAAMQVADVNINETAYVNINVMNRGEQKIKRIGATIDIFSEQAKLTTITTARVPLNSLELYSFRIPYETKGLLPGLYRAAAIITYDDAAPITKELNFRVGTKDIALINYTKEFIQGKINKFEFIIESGWNNILKEVYVTTTISQGGIVVDVIKTPAFPIIPWQRIATSNYWDTTNRPAGNYDAKFRITFDGNEKDDFGSLRILLPPIEEEPVIEQPKSAPSTLTMILIGIVVILMALNLYFLMPKKRRDDEDDF